MVGLFLLGCGASYQAVYEGEVRFEHCYRLDEEPRVPLRQRRECWREWTEFYTFGQTRDRLEYALRRQRELTLEIENPDVVHEKSELSKALSEPLGSPAPTNAFTAPPRTQDEQAEGDAGPPTDGSKEFVELLTSGRASPMQACVVQCVSRWKACTDACHPKSKDECQEGCHAAYRLCGAKCLDN